MLLNRRISVHSVPVRLGRAGCRAAVGRAGDNAGADRVAGRTHHGGHWRADGRHVLSAQVPTRSSGPRRPCASVDPGSPAASRAARWHRSRRAATMRRARSWSVAAARARDVAPGRLPSRPAGISSMLSQPSCPVPRQPARAGTPGSRSAHSRCASGVRPARRVAARRRIGRGACAGVDGRRACPGRRRGRSRAGRRGSGASGFIVCVRRPG